MEKSDISTHRTFETIKAEQHRLETKSDLWLATSFGCALLGPAFGGAAGLATMALTKSQDLSFAVGMLVGGASLAAIIPSFRAARKIDKMIDRLDDARRDLNKAALNIAATGSAKTEPVRTTRQPENHAEKARARVQGREQREENNTRTSHDDTAYLNTHLVIGAIAGLEASNSPAPSCPPTPSPTPSDGGSSISSSSGYSSSYSSSYDSGSSGGGFSGGSDGGGGGCAFAPQML